MNESNFKPRFPLKDLTQEQHYLLQFHNPDTNRNTKRFYVYDDQKGTRLKELKPFVQNVLAAYDFKKDFLDFLSIDDNYTNGFGAEFQLWKNKEGLATLGETKDIFIEDVFPGGKIGHYEFITMCDIKLKSDQPDKDYVSLVDVFESHFKVTYFDHNKKEIARINETIEQKLKKYQR